MWCMSAAIAVRGYLCELPTLRYRIETLEMAEPVVILLSAWMHAAGLDAFQIRRTWVRDQILQTYLPEICVDISRRGDYGNAEARS